MAKITQHAAFGCLLPVAIVVGGKYRAIIRTISAGTTLKFVAKVVSPASVTPAAEPSKMTVGAPRKARMQSAIFFARGSRGCGADAAMARRELRRIVVIPICWPACGPVIAAPRERERLAVVVRYWKEVVNGLQYCNIVVFAVHAAYWPALVRSLRGMCMVDLRRRFGLLVAANRRRRGLTQEQLAEAADISADMIAKIETGASGARFPVIERIAGALDVDPAELFSAEMPSGLINRAAFLDISTRLAGLSGPDLAWMSGIVEAALAPKTGEPHGSDGIGRHATKARPARRRS